MTGKCGADCTNRCSIGACPKAETKDEFDGFILDFDEDAVAKRNAEREQAQTESACKLNVTVRATAAPSRRVHA